MIFKSSHFFSEFDLKTYLLNLKFTVKHFWEEKILEHLEFDEKDVTPDWNTMKTYAMQAVYYLLGHKVPFKFLAYINEISKVF